MLKEVNKIWGMDGEVDAFYLVYVELHEVQLSVTEKCYVYIEGEDSSLLEVFIRRLEICFQVLDQDCHWEIFCIQATVLMLGEKEREPGIGHWGITLLRIPGRRVAYSRQRTTSPAGCHGGKGEGSPEDGCIWCQVLPR